MSIEQVPLRPLGSQGLKVSAQGLGCMGMTAFYGTNPKETEAQSMECFEQALKCGVNFLDTAWIYQDAKTGETNEGLIGRALAKFGRDKFVVATKFGVIPQGGTTVPDSSEARMKEQLEQSLAHLGTSYIDLYYQHRPDPNVPIEDVMRVLKDFIAQGKVKYVGLSEVTGDELRRAHAVHPVTAIQMEWSLQTRDAETAVVPVARELGVGIVCYSPLGRGLLSQTFTKFEDVPDTDWRKGLPRFTKDNFEKNNAAIARLGELAVKKGCTTAQLALAWLHSRGEDVFPIPGTTKAKNLVTNAASVHIKLTPEECAEIEATIPEGYGDRYNNMKGTFNQRV
jgi:aryl-alcohol dehydrogenase-like predicted oxidoreductase